MYAAASAPVPPGVVTETATAPAGLDGVVQVIVVEFTTTTEVAAVPPKFTPVAPLRLVPVIVTEVPPAKGPPVAMTPVTVGTP